MPGKGKKKKSKKKTEGDDDDEEGGGGGGGKKGKSKKSSSKFQGDILSDAAMENAYFCCHNVQELLKSRGFNWPDAQKKKGKKGKKK